MRALKILVTEIENEKKERSSPTRTNWLRRNKVPKQKQGKISIATNKQNKYI
jgi:hypothetical protein